VLADVIPAPFRTSWKLGTVSVVVGMGSRRDAQLAGGGTVRHLGRTLVCAAFAAAWAVAGQGKSLELKSAWSATPVKVDGTGEGWSANFVPVGDPPILVSVENDAQYLYVCVRTSDPNAKSQIALGGLTVWVAAPKGDTGGMGVRFPMHARGQGAHRPRGSGEGESSQGPPANAINDVSTQFELLGPTREDSLVVERDPGQPVQVAIGDDSGVLVYQVRLPLQPSDDHPVAVGAAAGTPVTLVLDTKPPKRQAPPEGADPEGGGEPPQGDGGRGPGGYGGGGMEGMPHGSRGGGHWGGGPGRGGFKSFKLDLAVTLASAPPAKAGS
jgi:hypothetical protein